MSRSLWIDQSPIPPIPETPLPAETDVLVVGAGLTGLVSAVLLTRAGRDVTVVEARRVGAVTTGNTTAKVSLLQGTRLSSIRRKHPREAVRSYVEANLAGQQWLIDYANAHGVSVQTRPAVTYATTHDGEQSARRELAAAQEAGLAVSWVDDVGLPFETLGGVWLDEQAQLDPMELLGALTAEIGGGAGAIHENTRVVRVSGAESGQRVTTTRGSILARTVILATGTPVLDRGGFFARLSPDRSYAAAFETAGPLPEAMFLSADEPTRSIRTAPSRDGGELLLTGGNGHVVGRGPSPSAQIADLTKWTLANFPGARRTHWWSAQDYAPIDELPYVGPLTPRNDTILVATGYAKWGMTNAVAAALDLCGRITRDRAPWQPVMQSWRSAEVTGVPRAAVMNASVGLHLVRGYLQAGFTGADGEPPGEGAGRVERSGLRPIAVCTVEGTTYRVSAVCPHLKGVVRWNDAERTWDCPLHGSRFAPAGDLLEGPAVTGLHVPAEE